jgi:hypothetical protein
MTNAERGSDTDFPPHDDRPPICAACGVTMVPAELSSRNAYVRGWVCVECEETAEPDEASATTG